MTFRRTPSVCSFALLICLACQSPNSGSLVEKEPSPNFIVILSDNLGYGDIDPFGSTENRTPNLDRMATEGIKLTNFYVASSVCSPSRAALMTGCYPARIGLQENEDGRFVLFPGSRRGLSPSEITIAELLKQQGYITAIVGKWHLGDQAVFLPTRQGFDSYFGIPYSVDMGRYAYPKVGYPPLPLLQNEEVIETEPDLALITRRYTQKAIDFISQHKDGPFFLYLAHSMPHYPVHASDEFRDKSANGIYCDAVEEIDWSTGRILDVLKDLEIDSRTLVVFTSDNGAWG